MGLEDKAPDSESEGLLSGGESGDGDSVYGKQMTVAVDYWVDDDGNKVPPFRAGGLPIDDMNKGEIAGLDASSSRRKTKTKASSGFRLRAAREITPGIDPDAVDEVSETLSQVRETSRHQHDRLEALIKESTMPAEDDEDDDEDVSLSQRVPPTSCDWRRSTMPDLAPLKSWADEQERPFLKEIDRETELRQYFASLVQSGPCAFSDIDDDEFRAGYSLDNVDLEVELAEIRRETSTLPPAKRGERSVEKNYRYKVPWWKSSNSLVRLWGQLDAALQILSDEQLVKDVVDVLGNHPFLKTDDYENQQAVYSFAKFIRSNVPYLKQLIVERYPGNESVFAAIIEKQVKEE